ncbi:MAG: acetoacetyl-CoA reductase [Magnetococcus sp. DMHC-6]
MGNRIALVTGGVGGMGTEICRELAHKGCTVVGTYIAMERDHAQVWLKDRLAENMKAAIYELDGTQFDSCRETVAQVEKEVGPIDILVNNAGITRDGTLKKMDSAQWLAVINTNLNSVFNMTRNVIDGMLERKFGRIINISSINGRKGQFGQTNYSAAKAGMHGFTMALAQETASKGITVNTVSPGYTATKMMLDIPQDILNKIIAQIPVGRLAKPEEIARVVSFLAADENGFITGANIDINGGQYMG